MKKIMLMVAAVAVALLASVGNAAPEEIHKAKVVFTKTAGGYTYLKVNEAGKELWIASSALQVSVGEEVEYMGGDVMTQFRSNAMDQTFDAIRFVARIHVVGKDNAPVGAGGMPADAAHRGASAPKAALAPAKSEVIAKARNGQTVAELFDGRGRLSGKNVVLRGKVLKFSENILGKNWITLADGSGKAPDDRIVVVTAATTSVGAVVTVTGVLKADVNLGSGYQYKVILDDAKLTK